MRRPRSRIAILSVLIVAVLIFLGVVYAWNAATDIFKPAADNGPAKNVSITITKGESTAEIADDLQSKGLIRNALAFRIWARIKGLDTTLQAGVYKKLNSHMTISDIIDNLQNATPDATRVLIKEGLRLEEIAQDLANANPRIAKFNKDDFLKYTKHADQFPGASQSPILKILPPGQNSMEGLLFPSTYEIPVDADTTQVINQMLKTMNDMVQQNKIEQLAQQHQMKLYDAITLASIVEREAKASDDRTKIASVYWNRLYSQEGKNETGGLMQADPTVQYARDTQNPPSSYWLPLGDSPANIAPNSLWNTYTQIGLPPTPICSAGLASLLAASKPAQTDYVYFFAGDDGQTHYAKTNAQFEQLKQQYGVRQQ